MPASVDFLQAGIGQDRRASCEGACSGPEKEARPRSIRVGWEQLDKRSLAKQDQGPGSQGHLSDWWTHGQLTGRGSGILPKD